MFVIGSETYSDTQFKGARVKTRVARPDDSGNKPDLSFEAPTCSNRGLGLFLHGKVGYFISQQRDLFVNSVDSQCFWGMDNYKDTDQIHLFEKNNSNFLFSRKTHSLSGGCRGTGFQDSAASGKNSIQPTL